MRPPQGPATLLQGMYPEETGASVHRDWDRDEYSSLVYDTLTWKQSASGEWTQLTVHPGWEQPAVEIWSTVLCVTPCMALKD